MDVEESIAALLRRLEKAETDQALGKFRVVVMNDFSLDRSIFVENIASFVERMNIVYSQKGGLLPETRQCVNQGGCAANTAITLRKLGAQVSFITRTSDLGLVLLDHYLGKAGVDIAHAKQGGSLALATCLEVGAERYNIMVDDGESFGGFGFDDLDASDLRLLEGADLVGVFDWCLNARGTDLAAGLFEHLGPRSIPTYFDTSDPTPRRGEIPELFSRVLRLPSLTYLNLNENELRQFSGTFDCGDSLEQLSDLAHRLKRRVPAALSVHTERFSIHVDSQLTMAPAFRVRPIRTTGAGDSWNGGNIAGILLDLPPAQRLLLANAVAAYYVASPNGSRPSLSQLIGFLRHAWNERHSA
jgi:sugar/nucleoside kinase (ribokinase family)